MQYIQMKRSSSASADRRQSMLRSIGHRRLLLILLLLLIGLETPVYALNFGAYWLYRQAGGENLKTRKEFQQRYSLGVGPSLTYQPTRAITATAAVGYSRSQADQGHGMFTTEELTPTARLSLINDIFLAQVSGSSTTRKSEARKNTSQSWDTTLASTWKIPLWPSLHFNYGERTDDIDSSLKNTYSSMGVTWDLILAKLSYQHSISNEEDRANNFVSESDSHFARLESTGSFWDKRIAFNLAQQYQTSALDKSQGTTLILSGEAWGKFMTGSTANNPEDPTDSVYVDPVEDPDKVNLMTGTETLTLASSNSVHISFRPSDISEPPLNTLRIYTENSTADSLVWTLYSRPSSADDWQPVATSLPLQGIFVDDSKGRRIEIALPSTVQNADEILLVANNSIGPLTFTKVEAVSFLTNDFSSNSTDLLTNFSLQVRLTRTLSASANLTLEHVDSENDTINSTRDHRILSGRLSWVPAPYLIPSLGYSENLEQQTGKADQVSRYYSLTVATIPLQSMHVVFGVTHNERYDGELQTDASDRYSLSTKAQIYPDLSSDLSFSQTDSEQRARSGSATSVSAFSSRLNLNARLLQGLTADFTTNYLNSRQENPAVSGDQNSKNADMTFGLLYRPSDLLALHGSYTKYLLDSKSVDTYSINLNLGLMRTDKTRLTLLADHRHADTTSDSFTLNGSWDISKNLSMVTRASYTIGNTDFYNIMTTLTLWL